MKCHAPGIDQDGNKVTEYWIFTDIKGREKENLDEYYFDIVIGGK